MGNTNSLNKENILISPYNMEGNAFKYKLTSTSPNSLISHGTGITLDVVSDKQK